MSSIEMKLISAAEYYDALLTSIPKAKRRIVIHAMTILWNTQTETIASQLSSALARGVEVRIVGDIYSKFYANTPKLLRTIDNRKWAHTRAINIRLEAEGAHIVYVGKLGLNPFKGRTHSKITIVDDTAYTFGGVNFTDGSFQNHDYMMRIKDKELSEELYQLVLAIGDAKQPLPDRVVPLSSSATMLFDGGMPSSSAIYDKACEIVGKAQKVYYVSQMVPSGRLAKLVTSIKNECYFNHPTQADTPSNLAILVDQTRYGISNLYKGKRYIHAKFILCEYADGSKHLISGSNNFSWRGIAYGTRELAVYSTDEKLWDSFYEYMQQEIVQPATPKAT